MCLATTASRILTEPHNLSDIGINGTAQLSKQAPLDIPGNAQRDKITGTTDNTHGIWTHTIPH